jgi:hypothetical protein
MSPIFNSRAIVQGTDTISANGIRCHVKTLPKIERFRPIKDGFKALIAQIPNRLMEKTRANFAIDLDYSRSPRCVAHGRFWGFQAQ